MADKDKPKFNLDDLLAEDDGPQPKSKTPRYASHWLYQVMRDAKCSAGDIEQAFEAIGVREIAIRDLFRYANHDDGCATRNDGDCTCGWEDCRARLLERPPLAFVKLPGEPK